MFKFPTLNPITLGEATPEQAQAALKEVLRESDTSRDAAQHVYAALRAWTWKALDQRRRDSELRHWHDVLKSTSAYLLRNHKDLADMVQVLHELISESIAVAELSVDRDVLSHLHISEALELLKRAGSDGLSRKALLDNLELKQANGTRVLNLMLAVGLIERSRNGREAAVRLSRYGAEEAKKVKEIVAPVSTTGEYLLARVRAKRRAAIGNVKAGPPAYWSSHMKRVAERKKSHGRLAVGALYQQRSRTQPDMGEGR